jgi:glutamate-1-semialdehyde 2,1-aminomutase
LLKFTGCYHGHADPFLASAGSGLATLSIPGTPGVPESTVEHTLLAPYNDLGAARELFRVYGQDIAAIIVEPVAANMGLVPPVEGFLQGLRSLCDEHGALLIFDEVITGFRASYGGAQSRMRITPDLTTFGKIIGGGLPVGAFGGKAEYMRRIAPEGDIYQAGTLAGNPLAMAAGAATLRLLRHADYAALEARVEGFAGELEAVFAARGIDVNVARYASMFSLFFTRGGVRNFEEAKRADTKRFTRLYKGLRGHGIYFAPSPFETAMVSFAHTEEDFARTLEAAAKIRL